MGSAVSVPRALLDEVLGLAAQASAEVLRVYNTDFAVDDKDDKSPLTAADLASHRTIVDGLERLTPGVPVLSEESAAVAPEERLRWSRFWLVDPLDGTREFVKRNGEFTVNIALIEDHQPILGVVQVPVTGVSYFAARGHGAFKRVPGRGEVPIRVAPRAEGPVRVVGSRSHRGSSLDRFLQALGEHRLLTMGSSLKFCAVADGTADVYPRLGPTSEWDTAAAQCIVEEAGGRVLDTELRPLRYNTKESLLNPHFLVVANESRDWSAMLSLGDPK